MQVSTFGFSAFLKLVCLNHRPQRSLVRERLHPSGDGYDFHRSLKLRIAKLLAGEISPEEAFESLTEIARLPERQSAKNGLSRFLEWRSHTPGEVLSFGPATFGSPKGNFKVVFDPSFGIRTSLGTCAIHVWNNAQPKLDPRLTYAALSLFPEQYQTHEYPPDDLAVLSLKNGELYRLGAAADHSEVGQRLAEKIDELFENVRRELGDYEPPAKEPPPAPPPTY